jgi:hypothetical protein
MRCGLESGHPWGWVTVGTLAVVHKSQQAAETKASGAAPGDSNGTLDTG